MSPLNIFVTGATGYLGGTVLSRLLAHPKAGTFRITALARTEEKAKKLRALGVNVVLGSYSDNTKDLNLLSDTTAESDITIALADSDHLKAAEAILKGAKTRFEKTGKAPILIHTSGTAILVDDANGLHGDQNPTSDLDIATLDAIPQTVLHRNVDTAIIRADEEGYVVGYLVTPSTIFGYPTGIVAEKGVQNIYSIQIPALASASIAAKQVGYVGNGLNVWCAVQVDDAADFYIVLLDSILTSPGQAGHGRNGYYFLESVAWKLIELSQTLSDAFVALGADINPDLRPFTDEEVLRFFGPIFGSLQSANAIAKGDRPRALGWKPRSSEETKTLFLQNIRDEAARILHASSK